MGCERTRIGERDAGAGKASMRAERKERSAGNAWMADGIRMSWVDLIRERLRANLGHLPTLRREQVVEEELTSIVTASESGRPFGEAPREGDADFTDEPVTSRGEKLSDLRSRAHKEWE
jgi:hypothetical protein